MKAMVATVTTATPMTARLLRSDGGVSRDVDLTLAEPRCGRRSANANVPMHAGKRLKTGAHQWMRGATLEAYRLDHKHREGNLNMNVTVAPQHAPHHHVPSSPAPSSVVGSGGNGHGGHHGPGVFPGQPPAYVLPKATGPGVVQPPDVPDTAKGSPLPHWDGVLLGSAFQQATDGVAVKNLYVNGAFNYMDHVGTMETALAEIQQLTAGPERPAAVLWRDKFGIIHAQALLEYGGMQLGPNGAKPVHQAAPVAAHLTSATSSVNLGHPEAIAIVDGDIVFHTAVPDVTPIKDNGAGWPVAGA